MTDAELLRVQLRATQKALKESQGEASELRKRIRTLELLLLKKLRSA